MKDFKNIADDFARLIFSLRSKEEVIESVIFAFHEAGKSGAKLVKIKDVLSKDLTVEMKVKVISEIIDIKL